MSAKLIPVLLLLFAVFPNEVMSGRSNKRTTEAVRPTEMSEQREACRRPSWHRLKAKACEHMPWPFNRKCAGAEKAESSEESSEEEDLADDIQPSLHLQPPQIEKIRAFCRENDCRTPSATAQALKARRVDKLLEVLGEYGLTEGSLTRQMRMMHRAKQALLKANGIDDVVTAVDDGSFAGDLLLSEEQSQALIDKYEGEASEAGKRSKRYAVHLETDGGSKWSLPVKFLVHADFTAEQNDTIHEAIADIERKTCVRFEEMRRKPRLATAAYLMFVRSDGEPFCGLSPLGRTSLIGSISLPNTITLNFDRDCEGQMVGSTAHEILHSLGVHHHQVRYDRKKYIDIDWSRVDVRNYDFFDGVFQGYTSYGLPYDYFSVMHYPANAGSKNFRKPAMVPTLNTEYNTEVLGQRIGLSDGDAALVRKMYCEPDCHDRDACCGWWATEGYCKSKFDLMVALCQKSCRFCPGLVNERVKEKLDEKKIEEKIDNVVEEGGIDAGKAVEKAEEFEGVIEEAGETLEGIEKEKTEELKRKLAGRMAKTRTTAAAEVEPEAEATAEAEPTSEAEVTAESESQTEPITS